MEAIIFANQCDDQLKKHIGEIPTSMATINGKPLISYVISLLVDHGFDNAIIIVGEMHDVIEDYVGYEFHGMRINYSQIKKNSSLTSAILKAVKQIKSKEVFLLDGSVFFQVPYDQMKDTFLQHKANMLMALTNGSNKRLGFAVNIDDKFRVQSISEKSEKKEKLIFGGTCAVQKNSIEKSIDELVNLFNGKWPDMPFAAIDSYGLPLDNFYFHLATADDYIQSHDEFRDHKIR